MLNKQYLGKKSICYMCYRASTPTASDLRKMLDKEIMISEYTPHYHTAGFDHQELPVMLNAEADKVQPVTWGFTPEGMSDTDATKYFKSAYSLNAKAETIFSVPLYKSAAKHKRCLIFVNGFFEWKHEGKDKIPFYIRMPDHKPFALGGLWAERDGAKTCNILTTPANELMTTIHNSKKRMPFILPEDDWELWLDQEAEPDKVKKVIRKFPEGYLQAHEISRMITARGVEKDVKAIQEPV